MSNGRRIQLPDERNEQELQQSDDPDSEFQHRIQLERMPVARSEAWERQAANAHSAHERRKQDAE